MTALPFKVCISARASLFGELAGAGHKLAPQCNSTYSAGTSAGGSPIFFTRCSSVIIPALQTNPQSFKQKRMTLLHGRRACAHSNPPSSLVSFRQFLVFTVFIVGWLLLVLKQRHIHLSSAFAFLADGLKNLVINSL